MSIFKEKDDCIIEAFQNLDSSDSDSEQDDTKDRSKLDKEFSLGGDEHVDKKVKTDEYSPRTPDYSECSLDEDVDKKVKTDDYSPRSPDYSECSEIDQIECIEIDCDESDDKISTRCRIPPKRSEHVSIPVIDISDSSIEVESDSFQPLPPINISQDLDDYEFNLKLRIAGYYRQFPTHYKTRFCDTLRDLLGSLRSQGKTLVITTDQLQSVPLDESPFTLKLKPGIILNAIEVSDHKPGTPPLLNPDDITVKIQDGNKKHTKEFRASKNKPISFLKEKYAKEFNIDSISKIKFLFDGDVVGDDSTPEELEIEDDCVIDVFVSSA